MTKPRCGAQQQIGISFNPNSEAGVDGIAQRLDAQGVAPTKAVFNCNTAKEAQGPERQSAAARPPLQLRSSGLKQDGTLWRWGTNYHDKTAWFGLRDFSPQRLGMESDWARLQHVSGWGAIYAWKKDGRAWVIYPHTPVRKDDARELEPEVWIEPVPGFDHFHWRSLAQGYQYLIGVREDGTLWINHQKAARNTTRGKFFASNLAQFGNDTNWLAVAGDFWNPVALKADGTLWKWPLNPNFRNETSPATRSPVRLGRHHDWLAVGYMPGGSVSLAADGSLWYWSGERSSHPLLAPSRKPDRIGSISLEERP